MKVYNFDLDLSWELLSTLSEIDRFDASWSSIEKLDSKSLTQLKAIATIKRVGASTRIEGARYNDKEVEGLLENIDISKIEDRDTQEVVGYFNVLDLIIKSFEEIEITESNIKNLHNQLMRYNEKDLWHKGQYKKHANAVEASFPDGSKQIIFRTTEPGFATDDAMRALINWFNEEKTVHPIIKNAAFVYDFLSIHPFQDGNGRLSRLLTTLLLLGRGYSWIQYVSFEHEIENNKKDYYRCLRSCQAQRPNENITEWITFFLNALLNIKLKLEEKLVIRNENIELEPKEKAVYVYISNHHHCKSGELTAQLNIPKPTVKRLLQTLLTKKLISKFGKGAGTYYEVNK